MITCEVFRRHVDAVVDGEVDPTTQIEFEQHLSGCGPCRVHLAFAESFKQRLKEGAVDGAPPPDLASRIRTALDAEDLRRAAERGEVPVGASAGPSPPLGLTGIRLLPFKAKYAVPAAAAAVALALIAAREGGNPMNEARVDANVGSTLVPGGSYLEDIVDRHGRAYPVEVSGPPRQVESWFDGKVPFRVRPVEFASPDVRFVGARISNVREREAAQLFYDVRGRRITVLVFEPPRAAVVREMQRRSVAGRGIYYGYARGRAVPLVEHGGLTYAIAGDLDERQLLRLAASARVADR